MKIKMQRLKSANLNAIRFISSSFKGYNQPKTIKNNNAVAILSGGIDSSVMAWSLADAGVNFTSFLTFDYGQRHKKELESAKQVVIKFNEHFKRNVPHQVIDLSSSFHDLLRVGALTGGVNVPKTAYDEKTQRLTVVPNRNMIFISIAAAKAVSTNSALVAYAAHSGDHSTYPDCRPEFVNAMREALKCGNEWTPVDLIAPFVHSSKADIVKEGIRLNVPMEVTWSCYDGLERPCLKCGTCLDRANAFHLCNHDDPSLTQSESQQSLKILMDYIQKQPQTTKTIEETTDTGRAITAVATMAAIFLLFKFILKDSD